MLGEQKASLEETIAAKDGDLAALENAAARKAPRAADDAVARVMQEVVHRELLDVDQLLRQQLELGVGVVRRERAARGRFDSRGRATRRREETRPRFERRSPVRKRATSARDATASGASEGGSPR